MVFGANGEALIRRVETGTARDSPAQHYAIEFEAEIIVQPGRVVFLHDKRQLFAFRDTPRRRFWRLLEIALAAVFF